jgi:hypothetical protein
MCRAGEVVALELKGNVEWVRFTSSRMRLRSATALILDDEGKPRLWLESAGVFLDLGGPSCMESRVAAEQGC